MFKSTFLFCLTAIIMLISCRDKERMVLISTQYGDIKVKLYNETPQHRDNFVKLAQEGFYNGTLFHRVIREFMVQGGDPNSKNAQPGAMLGNGGPGYTIPAEILPAFYHKKGALSAARLGDQMNPKRESSGSQFYMVQGKVWTDAELSSFEQRGLKLTPEQKEAYKTIGGTPHLDGAYTVFGEIVEGLEVVDKIANAPIGQADRPVEDIKMTVKLLN